MRPEDHRTFYKPLTDLRGRQIARLRGLTASDVDWLWQAHEDAVERVYEEWSKAPDTGAPGLLMSATQHARDLVLDIITTASDGQDWELERRAVSKLPSATRDLALSQILSMTFGSEGGLGDTIRRREASEEDEKPQRTPVGTRAARFVMTIRKAVSLLFQHGHPHAARQPLGRIFMEAEIVEQRTKRAQANDAVLMQKTVGSLIDEKIGKDFSKWIREIAENGD
ncbi:phage pre-tape measure protein [Paenirhodobacter populi]|uniref:Uncharacterized protein n=1 Tax=Paenirhodobacter populi TaxID=2306993 RepID=A0A443J0B0_9RHOB|nr:hypothetical protein [Sinirhodobacter populi]RWR13826.1 hypothetical protein D2T33_05355 [Sinirhodobacter populi]